MTAFEDRLSIFDRYVQKYGRLPREDDTDYLEMLHMSKYVITDNPFYKPGKCANCGSSKVDGRKYINFGLDVDWYGIVYICNLCFKDIADNVGLFDEIKAELEASHASVQKLEDLKAQGENLHEVVLHTFNELEGYYAGLHSLRDDPPSDISPYVEPESPASVEPTVVESKPAAIKPTPKPRSKDVRSLADLLEPSRNE